jgi:hypothetical protein
MKKLLMLATAVASLIAVTEPTFAASRASRADQAQAAGQLDQVRRDYYGTFGPGHDAFARGNGGTWSVDRGTWSGGRINSDPDGRGNGGYGYVPGQNLPYPDRPYGAPDKD